MKVRFTRQADDDIIESYLYGFRTFGQAQAKRYEEDLRHVIGLIADHPHMAAERHDYRPPVRIHHHARHYIVYLIDGDHILVIRILRDNVDLTQHLSKDPTSS